MRRRAKGEGRKKKEKKKLINGRKKPRRLTSRNGAKFASMMQLIFFFSSQPFDSDTVWKVEKRWRYLNFILAYYSFLFFLFSFTGKGRLKGTRIRYESSSLKNIFHFFCHSIFYFHFFFYYIGGTNLETWKVGEIKANDYSREDEKSSSTRWKKISILRCSPAGNLSLATLHPISNVDSYGKGRRPFDSTRDWSIFLTL